MQVLPRVTLEFSRRGDNTGSGVEELNVGRKYTDKGPRQLAEFGQEKEAHGRNEKGIFKGRACIS